MPTTKGLLRALGDTKLSLADPTEDVRGRHLVDANGDEIGKIVDLIIDAEQRKVRFLSVVSGGFLGLGRTRFLVPVDVITQVDSGVVTIDRTRELVAAAPPYEPRLVDESYWERLYTHYGRHPYWSDSYVFPKYPYNPRL